MKPILIAIMLLTFSSVAVAHKETEAQKKFITYFAKELERVGGWPVTWIGVKGKAGDVFGINLSGASVEAVGRFERQFIESGNMREQLKAAGFHYVLIATGVRSVTYPKGEVVIPLD